MEDEMTQTTQETVVQAAGRPERGPFAETVRKVLLAGIGAVALAQDEIEEFVQKLVERGELAEADGKKVVKDVLERQKRLFKDEARKAEGLLDRRIEAILNRLNLPTREEFAALNERIAELTRKIEELKKAD